MVQCSRPVAWSLLLVGLVGIIIAAVLYAAKGQNPQQHGVVVDGGSSHTSVSVYKWDGPKWFGTGIVDQVGYCSSRGDLSSLWRNLSAVHTFLQPCLTNASKLVPESSQSATPIYFAATAGLRLLNMTNPSGASLLLEEIKKALNSTGLRNDVDNVEILSGSREGLFSWITVNTKSKTMGPLEAMWQAVSTWATEPQQKRETIGALDLGGASTQFSVEIGFMPSVNPADVNSVRLYGSDYTVYSKSYLCYGINEATKRYHAMLIKDSGGAETTVTSPCLPRGFSMNLTASTLFESPCTSRSRPTGLNVDTVLLVGASDVAQCERYIQVLFNQSACQSYFGDNCYGDGRQPNVDKHQFMGFSKLYHVGSVLNSTSNTTRMEFMENVAALCSLSYEEAVKLPLLDQQTARLMCSDSQYVLALLTAYGFDESSWTNLKFVDKVDNLKIGWSLGYMTEKSNWVDAVDAQPLLSLTVFIIILIIFILLLLSGVLVFYFVLSKAPFGCAKYEPPENC